VTESEIELFKVQWRTPHIALNKINKLSMLRALESSCLSMNFRSWDLYEYSLLQNMIKHGLSKRRLNLISRDMLSLQIGRKNVMSRDVSVFDDYNLSNVKVYLNSQFFRSMI